MPALMWITAFASMVPVASEVEEFEVVRHGQPACQVVLGAAATPTEEHAASELVKYVQQMTGATLPVVRIGEEGGGRGRREVDREELGRGQILIGRAETHPLIAQLVANGSVSLSPEALGEDGFVLKTLSLPFLPVPSSALLLSGCRDRGTLYAVYTLLERYAGVGFFWDGDRVPRQETLTFPDLDAAERPRFRDRIYVGPCGCAGTYSYGIHWGFEEWRREIDWMAKNRLNLLQANGLGEGVIRRRVEAQLGLPATEPTEAERRQCELAHQVLDYLHRLDLEALTPFPGTQVSKAFRQVHPEARYFENQWLDLTPPAPHLHPADPLYARLVETFLREWTAEYGSDHLYYGMDPYPEARFKTSEEERTEILTGLSKAVMSALKSADPQAVWHISGWAFVFDTGVWPAETLRAFCEPLGEDAVIWDLWAEAHPVYNTERGRYFYGCPWAFGVLHQFGGDDALRGDLQEVARRVRAVAHDPQAERCVGFVLATEVLHYTILYYDWLTKLAWDPDLELEAFLDDHVRRRYGPDQTDLRRVVKILAETVYGPLGASEGRYQHRLYPGENPYSCLPPATALKVIERLEQALELALGQRQALADNLLYQHDLVDLFRQVVTERINLHLQLLDSAFARGDREGLEAEAEAIEGLLKALETVLSSRPDYRVTDVAARLQATSPLGGDVGRWLRDSGLTFAQAIPGIIDYQSKDLYELVRFYYHPRFQAFAEVLRDRLDAGVVDHETLDLRYSPIEQQWVEAGYDPAQAPPYPGNMIQAVAEAWAAVRADAGWKRAADQFALRRQVQNGDFEEGFQGWQVSRQGAAHLEVVPVPEAPDRHVLHLRITPENVPKSGAVSQILIAPEKFTVRLRYRLFRYTGLANVNLRLEGFDAAGRKKIQAVYFWGGDNWDHGDRPPEETGGFWSIRRRLPGEPVRWHEGTVDPVKDVDEAHGPGTWARQGIVTLHLTLAAWALEREAHEIDGWVDGVHLETP